MKGAVPRGGVEGACVTDVALMRRALALAGPQLCRTGENPAVGCVIAQGFVIVGEGVTAAGGRPHAEEQALTQAGEDGRGAIAYVTLEPCARRTSGAPSCAELLVQAGIVRVVIAARDPHPYAAGAGIEALRAAGIAVETGLMEAEARSQNAEFFAKWDKE